MKTNPLCAILPLFACVLFFAAPPASAEDAGDERIKTVLKRKVSFEFVDTPLKDALEFLHHLANVPVILDPELTKEGRELSKINLRVTDMEMETALKWILKLAELEYSIRDKAIFISTAKSITRAEDLQPLFRKEKIDVALKNDDNVPHMLRIKFPDGTMLEADGAVLSKMPHLANEIVGLAFDPAKDGILALLPGRDFPGYISVDGFVASAQKIAPNAQVEFDRNLKLVTVLSKDPADLKRINAVARTLKRGEQPGPMFAKKQEEPVEALEKEQAAMIERLKERRQQAEMELATRRKMEAVEQTRMAIERKQAAIEEDVKRQINEVKRRIELDNTRTVKPPRPPEPGKLTPKEKVEDQF